jgi:hypothetical protein
LVDRMEFSTNNFSKDIIKGWDNPNWFNGITEDKDVNISTAWSSHGETENENENRHEEE